MGHSVYRRSRDTSLQTLSTARWTTVLGGSCREICKQKGGKERNVERGMLDVSLWGPEGPRDSQSGVGDALAGDVPLNLGLVDPVDTGPDEGPTNAYGPESVSPQRVWVKAGSTVKTHHGRRQTDGKSSNDRVLFQFQQFCKDFWMVESSEQGLLHHMTHTHSQKLSLPPRSESEMMGMTPPCWSTDRMMTDRKPASMTPSWRRHFGRDGYPFLMPLHCFLMLNVLGWLPGRHLSTPLLSDPPETGIQVSYGYTNIAVA